MTRTSTPSFGSAARAAPAMSRSPRSCAAPSRPRAARPSPLPPTFTATPTFANHDIGSWHFVYEGLSSSFIGSTSFLDSVSTAFQEIEEGVYLGYRYYETARVLGALEYVYDRARGVVYPFGYGLSYTSFSQTITGVRTQGKRSMSACACATKATALRRQRGRAALCFAALYEPRRPLRHRKTRRLPDRLRQDESARPRRGRIGDVVLPCGKPGFLFAIRASMTTALSAAI